MDDELEREAPWADRLDAAALATAAGLVLFFAANVVLAMTTDIPEPGDMARYQRLQIATQVGNLAYGGVLLAAAGLVAARQWLDRDDPAGRAGIVELVVGSTAVVFGLCALVALVNDTLLLPDRLDSGQWMLERAGRHGGAILVAVAALWLAGTFRSPSVVRTAAPHDGPS